MPDITENPKLVYIVSSCLFPSVRVEVSADDPFPTLSAAQAATRLTVWTESQWSEAREQCREIPDSFDEPISFEEAYIARMKLLGKWTGHSTVHVTSIATSASGVQGKAE